VATLNKAVSKPSEETHEGAVATRISPEQQLRRSVMACLLWEDGFYEDGKSVAERIAGLVKEVTAEAAAKIAVEARTKQKLRHVPLLIVREMARLATHKHLVAKTLAEVIQRPDELSEFLAVYWAEKRQPLSAQVKKGLAAAFGKFDEYSLAKYDRAGKVKLRDVLFLCHAKPQAAGDGTKVERKTKTGTRVVTRHEGTLYGKLAAGTLATPDTWEVALSGGADKKAAFERLMAEKKLGALAFIRNLRNMSEAKVDVDLVRQYASTVPTDRVLPFRFIAAARAVPAWESIIEGMMLRCLDGYEKLKGRTVIVVDNSGSMYGTKVSAKSDIDRSDAAAALAVLIRQVCDDVAVIAFSDNPTVVPDRRGFALVDAIKKTTSNGTMTDLALAKAEQIGYDRVIVVTDEQSRQTVRAPLADKKGYFVNVSVCKNGIGYGKWVHIDGWSESILEYIRQFESEVAD
jgi:hypothetical protein